MKCPCCGKEMISGVVQGGGPFCFRTKTCSKRFFSDETLLSSHNWTRPTAVAYHCADCKKVVIDYSVDVK